VSLVSVIVTTYNRKDFLTETLNSILNQTYKNFELIVIDNFSNYDFFGLIESFNNKKIIPYQNQNNGIIAVNRNIGIKHAKGKYIAFCDDDDIWMRNKLDIQIKKLKEASCDFISGNTFIFKTDINKIIGKTKNRQIYSLKDFIRRNQVNTSTVLVRNTNDLRFKEDKILISIEDYALWLKLYIKGYQFGFINQPLAYYRINDKNISLKNWTTGHLREVYLLSQMAINNPNLRIKYQIVLKSIYHLIKLLFKMIYIRFSKNSYR